MNSKIEERAQNRLLIIAGSVITLAATVACALLGWMATSINELSGDVVAIRTELNLVKPADVLDAVRRSEATALRKQDVEQIVSKSAPWLDDRPDWLQWRNDTNVRLRDLELIRRAKQHE